jgi:hypothetical protein
MPRRGKPQKLEWDSSNHRHIGRAVVVDLCVPHDFAGYQRAFDIGIVRDMRQQRQNRACLPRAICPASRSAAESHAASRNRAAPANAGRDRVKKAMAPTSKFAKLFV